MKIIDLTDDRKELFSLCLEDWSDEAKESGPKRGEWLERCLTCQGLRAKLALDDAGTEGGMIQYGPIENSHVDGSGLYFVYCIHVHGHKQGRGSFRGHGMGTALLKAAEDDTRALGAKGLVAWGTRLPFWMRASWFRKHGYRTVDKQGIAALVWKPFTDDATPPRWIPSNPHLPDPTPGKVNVVAFSSGWCLAQNLVYERAKRAAAEFGDKVSFTEIETTSRDAVRQYGIVDAVLVDGRNLQKGPPPKYDAIRKAIAKRVAKLPS